MTDRRNRPVVRCQEPGCIHVGPWQVPYCPTHWPEVRGNLLAEVQRRQTPPQPTPLDVARDLLGGTTQPEGIR